MNYIDNLNEIATVSILKQLKVFLFNDGCSIRRKGKIINNDLIFEHKSSINKHYAITSGQVTFEFRDFADCYIRLVLNQGQSIDFPPDIYRRMYSSSSKQAEVYEDTIGTIIPRYNELQDGMTVPTYHTQRELVCELCRQFFVAGWVTGTGGSISIRHGNRIYMTPSGVQKERILPDELYVLDVDGNILNTPLQKHGCRLPKLSDCSPLFLHAFKQRNAGI
jgi:methylthioribulose 1-phosphate dehydratase/enolase-phosphatase E1